MKSTKDMELEFWYITKNSSDFSVKDWLIENWKTYDFDYDPPYCSSEEGRIFPSEDNEIAKFKAIQALYKAGFEVEKIITTMGQYFPDNYLEEVN